MWWPMEIGGICMALIKTEGSVGLGVLSNSWKAETVVMKNDASSDYSRPCENLFAYEAIQAINIKIMNQNRWERKNNKSKRSQLDFLKFSEGKDATIADDPGGKDVTRGAQLGCELSLSLVFCGIHFLSRINANTDA
ncbi:hypothetical protein JHK82_025564 [Glycine max]|nr:hypothetical protein JHK85_026181 [Glycine max]KAG5134376.1 hypothetical protein JHK82_025564 [Glycine max]